MFHGKKKVSDEPFSFDNCPFKYKNGSYKQTHRMSFISSVPYGDIYEIEHHKDESRAICLRKSIYFDLGLDHITERNIPQQEIFQ